MSSCVYMQSLIFYCFLHHQELFIWKIFILYSSCSSTGKYSNPEKCRITPLRRITPHRITPHNEMALAFKVCVCRNSFCWLLVNFSFSFYFAPSPLLPLDIWICDTLHWGSQCEGAWYLSLTGLSWLPSTLPWVSILLTWHLPHTKLPISLVNCLYIS